MSGLSPRIDAIEGNALAAASTSVPVTLMDLSPSNLIPVPFTQIVNRALILNLANDAGVRMGSKRIPIQVLHELQGESGASGESVKGVRGDDLGQIRFVGNWRTGLENTGTFAFSQSGSGLNDYMEVTFYGTGLNILTWTASPANNILVTVDGGAEGVTSIMQSGSGILHQQFFTENVIIQAVKGLALGVHTVRLRQATGGIEWRIFGVETLTESNSLVVNPGSIIGTQGGRRSIGAQQLVSYNSGFETGSLTSAGGRVLVYLKSDGTIGKAAQGIGSSAFLTATNHVNEEVLRSDYYRQYGSNRSDDFQDIGINQSLGVVDRQWALDDNSSILYAHRISAANEQNGGGGSNFYDTLAPYTNSYFVFQFVGTGLDFISVDGATGADTFAVTVDGVSVGNIVGVTAAYRTVKICSGLPYGSHVVRISIGTPTFDYFHLMRMVIYGPKKPTLPAGAIELCDYNVVANYVANATAGQDTIGQGVIRHSNSREMDYHGANWAIGSADVVFFCVARNISTATNGEYMEFTFFGTGLEFRFLTQATALTSTYLVDGLALNTSNFPGLVTSTYGSGVSYTGNTLTHGTGSVIGAGLSISGLTLGIHTIRITQASGSGNLYIDALDVITPIHAYQNLKQVNQLPFVIGNQGLKDSRQVSVKKAVTSVIDPYGFTVPSNSGTYQVIPGLMGNIEVEHDTEIEISAQISGNLNNSGVNIRFYLAIDGMIASPDGFGGNGGSLINSTTGFFFNCYFPSFIATVSKGTHFIQVYAECDSNSLNVGNGYSILTIKER